MTSTVQQRTVYKAFGLTFDSVMPLPELPPSSNPEEPAQVTIEYGDLQAIWQDTAEDGAKFAVKDGQLLFMVPDTAVYGIDKGNRITVSPLAGANADKVRLYVLGTCMGAVLLQRRILPLHGSAVVIDGRAYAFMGQSGAGKSTLTAAFLSQGYRFLTDDVIAITMNGEQGAPMVQPSYPQQKLWDNSIEQFGMQRELYQPLYQEVNKFAVPVASQFVQQPIPLGGVFELVKSENDDIVIRPFTGLERLRILSQHTYRNVLIPRLELAQWHFGVTAELAGHVPIRQIARPSSRFTAHELVSEIVKTVGKGAADHE